MKSHTIERRAQSHWLVRVTALGGALSLIACGGAPVDQSTSADVGSNRPAAYSHSTVPSNDTHTTGYCGESQDLESAFVKAHEITYHGYEVQRRTKKVRWEETGEVVTATYVVLMKGGKVVSTFDGVYGGAGNAAEFGLFPFLGGTNKQLFVSLDVPRGGTQWIVDLESEPHVIFRGVEFGVGRESADFQVFDIDEDGVCEVITLLPAFYLAFDDVAMYATPMPRVIMRYDARLRKYVPANNVFSACSLSRVRDLRENLQAQGNDGELGTKLDILIAYLLAGHDDEGWAFFRQAYTRPDRDVIEAKLRKILQSQPAYRYIQEHLEPLHTGSE